MTHDCSDYSCVWWGCWQDVQDPPGTQYGSDFASSAAGRSRFAMFTYYQLLQSYRQVDHNLAEGTDQVTITAVNVDFMKRYFADFRFLLTRIGNNPAIVHIEPDFWGYAQHAAREAGHNDPSQLDAAVATANSADCAAQPNTIAGWASA